MKKKNISRREFCKNAALITGGLTVGLNCDQRVLLNDKRVLLPPGNIRTEEDSCRVTITWDPLSDPYVSGYSITRTDTNRTEIIPVTDAMVFTDTTVVNDTTYTYRLAALDKDGSSGLVDSVTATPTFLTSPIVRVYSTQSASGMTLNQTKIKEMIQAGLVAFAGTATISDALGLLLREVSSASKIGLKTNCLASKSLGLNGCSTHPEVALAVGEILTENLSLPAENIIIFDDQPLGLTGAGFIMNDTGTGGIQVKQADCTGDRVFVHDSTQNLSKVLLTCDKIINLPAMKDHAESGVTFTMKNFFGCVDAPADMHGGNCSPYIPALYALDQIRSKVDLTIGDVIFGAYSGGPATAPNFLFHSIIIGTDPVALDYYALDTINGERAKVSAPSILVDGESGHVPAAYLKEVLERAPSDNRNPKYDLGIKMGIKNYKEQLITV